MYWKTVAFEAAIEGKKVRGENFEDKTTEQPAPKEVVMHKKDPEL